jgi:hypothetical protein
MNPKLIKLTLALCSFIVVLAVLAYLVMMPCYRKALKEHQRLRDGQGIESTGASPGADRHRRPARD